MTNTMVMELLTASRRSLLSSRGVEDAGSDRSLTNLHRP
jgi:hypothetical protein